nr:hypothetical protein [uncultured Cohaesibacter sp.]
MISGASSYMPIFRISNTNAVGMMIEKYDLDKSGDLDIDEAQNVPILSRANFETADSFGDGKLTEKEFMTYLDQMKMEVAQGNATNPMTLLLGGSAITEDVFSEIVSEVADTESKQTFIDYMLHLTQEYETAMKTSESEEGSNVDLSA